MTVTDVRLLYAYQTRYDQDGREYVGVYDVETTAATTQPQAVRNALPQLGDAYVAGTDSDPSAVVTGYGTIRPKQWPASRLVWSAEVKYSTIPLNPRRRNPPDTPPWEWPPEIRGNGVIDQIPSAGVIDNNNRPIENSAGWPFEELYLDNANPLLQIDLNVQFLNLGELWSSTFGLNINQFFGLLPRSWRLDPPFWQQRIWGDAQPYYAVSLMFRGNFRGWDIRPPDKGTLDKDGKAYFIGDISLQGIQDLDGAGDWLTPGDDPVIFDGVGNNPDAFEYYPEIDFGSILSGRVPIGLPP